MCHETPLRRLRDEVRRADVATNKGLLRHLSPGKGRGWFELGLVERWPGEPEEHQVLPSPDLMNGQLSEAAKRGKAVFFDRLGRVRAVAVGGRSDRTIRDRGVGGAHPFLFALVLCQG